MKQIAPTGGTETGIVKHISMGDRYGESRSKRPAMAEITVQYGEDPKPPKQGKEKKGLCCVPMDSPERSSIRVPVSLAKGLSIGDRVRIRVEKV
jgi:hypothetical protein